MTARQWMGVVALLGPVYVAAMIGAYWTWWPLEPTIRVIYSHPMFCSVPCLTREEAQQHQVASIVSGTPYVWHYREIQVTASRIGAIRSVWVAGGFIWNSPQIPTMGSPPGVYARSVAVVPPTSNPTRDFVWKTAFTYSPTPMRDETIEFPDVNLRVVANTK